MPYGCIFILRSTTSLLIASTSYADAIFSTARFLDGSRASIPSGHVAQLRASNLLPLLIYDFFCTPMISCADFVVCVDRLPCRLPFLLQLRFFFTFLFPPLMLSSIQLGLLTTRTVTELRLFFGDFARTDSAQGKFQHRGTF